MARTLGPVMPPMPRAGSATRARQFGLDDRARQHRKAGAAVFLGDVHLPEAEVLGALAEALVIFGLEFFGVGRGFALDRNHLVVDEAPQRVLEDAQLFGKLEVHC